MSRGGTWALLTLILLLAAVLRCWSLGDVPPGLSHDEVANGLIARQILGGHHAIYFTRAYGHEPLYQYVQAGTVALFGEHWLGLRWPSFAFSLLGLASVYSLMRRLFSRAVALMTISGLTIGFWPLFYARVGIRAISLPFIGALAAYCLVRTLDRESDTSVLGIPCHVLGGLLLGLSLYTYMAARVLPFVLAAFVLHRALISRERDLPWVRVLVLFLAAALIASPLLVWLARHPGAEYRIAEVRRPLDQLLAGDPSLVWHNLVANFGFFAITGDPWPHQGIPGRPVFAGPVGAALFYMGLGIAIWRWRTPRFGFLLIFLVGGLLPSILSAHAPPGLVSDAPSSVRNVLAQVVVFVFPALALTESWRWLRRRLDKQGAVLSRAHRVAVVAALLLPSLLLTVGDYYVRWPRREDVQYFYQADLTAVGHHLDAPGHHSAVTVGGLSVDSMDRPTLAFTARASVQDVRLCDVRETLVIPVGLGAHVLVPHVVPFGEGQPLRDRLASWSTVQVADRFDAYGLGDREVLDRHVGGLDQGAHLPDGTPVALPAFFSNRLALVGYERVPQLESGSVGLLTYWRVEDPPYGQLKAFVHLVREGQLVAQDDGLASPAEGWSSGDLVVQHHVLTAPSGTPPGLYALELGLYNPLTLERLTIAGHDRVLLNPVTLP